jgi:hypothetical protein
MTEHLGGRTCSNCACVYVAEPPRVPTAEQLRADPHVGNRPAVLVCRLNPPTTVMTPNGPTVIQQPTMPYISCWQWRPPGTLPGDRFAVADRSN